LLRCRAVLAVVALMAGTGLPLGAVPQPSTPLDLAAENAARTYLYALVDGDAAVLLRLTPIKLENKYGPCPFAEMPRLDSARVDAHRAGILFKGRTKDPALPDQGAITLTLLDGVTKDPWRVRQIAFFNRLPLGARVPKRSITARDRAQEPLVINAARRYVAAWLRGDYRTMNHLAFEWIPLVHQPAPGMRVRSIQFRATTAENGETKINFTAKVTMFRVLPKTLQGTLFAMREGNEWKIRGTELTI